MSVPNFNNQFACWNMRRKCDNTIEFMRIIRGSYATGSFISLESIESGAMSFFAKCFYPKLARKL